MKGRVIMTYGINFGRAPITEEQKKIFKREVKLPGMERGEYAILNAVADTDNEIAYCVISANNGKRKFHRVRKNNLVALYIY